jgi:hypothetical protein
MAALSAQECAALAQRAAAHVNVDTLPRNGDSKSVVLWEDEDCVAWLNVELDERDTGYHDHDGSAAGIYVLGGCVTNEGLPIAGNRRVHRYGPGDSFCLPATGIHRMNHDAGSVSVHVYSPPLRAIGSYEVVNGLLQRTPGPPDEASPESPRLLAALASDALAGAASSDPASPVGPLAGTPLGV